MNVDILRLLSFIVSSLGLIFWVYWGYKKKNFELMFAFATVLLHNSLYLGYVTFFNPPHSSYNQWAVVLRLHTLLVLLSVPVYLLFSNENTWREK